MKKLLSFRRLEEDTSLPKLKFGLRFRDSAYLKAVIHPVLDGFLSFLYRYGEIRDIGEISLSPFEEQKKKELSSLVKNGRLTGLDASAFSTYVLLAVLKKFLKSLPNCLLWRIRTEDWRQMAFLLPNLCDTQAERKEKLSCCVDKAQALMLQLKPPNRNFFHLLLAALQEISYKTKDPEIAALRLADYFAVTIMANIPESVVKDDVRIDLRAALRFFIMNIPHIFPDVEIHFVDELPLYNVNVKSKSEEVIEGEEAIGFCQDDEVAVHTPIM